MPAQRQVPLGVNTIPTVYWVRRYLEGFALHRYDAYAPNGSDIGVGFFDGGHLIVVAFDETALHFSSKGFTTNYGGSVPAQMTNGKTCRELTEAHAAAIGEGVDCAAGYCLAYQASGDIQRNWALPGIREWLAINKHVTEINKALQKNGSTIIDNGVYWTANTYRGSAVFYSNSYATVIDWNSNNYSQTYKVRPVLTF